MSTTIIVHGKLEKISPTKDETLEQYAKKKLKGALLCKEKWADENGYKKSIEPDSYIPYLLKELGDPYGFQCKYNILKESLYKIHIFSEQVSSGESLFLSTHRNNGDAYFMTSYYDGGMSLDDAICKSFYNPKPNSSS